MPPTSTLATPATLAAPDDEIDDAELARRAGAGEVAAFATLLRRHNRLLFRTARSLLRHDAEAEDALQEAWLRAWRGLPKFRAESRVSTWLVRIVIHEALGRLRRRGLPVVDLAAPVDDAEPDGEPWMQDHPDHRPDGIALRAELRHLIEARIDALPDAFRTVFMLRAVEEMSVEEVGAALQIPEATVRTRYFRARGLLRTGLSRDIDLAVDEAFSFDGQRCDRIAHQVLAQVLAQVRTQVLAQSMSQSCDDGLRNPERAGD
jgi:RNA polymerase sigma-70 factor (ECF subfamily)